MSRIKTQNQLSFTRVKVLYSKPKASLNKSPHVPMILQADSTPLQKWIQRTRSIHYHLKRVQILALLKRLNLQL